MKRTVNFNLKKPDYNDTVDIADINSNMDIIDAELKKKVSVSEIQQLKEEVANSEKIESKVDKIVDGKVGDILLKKEDGAIKSSGVQIQELVKETKFNGELSKLMPKVSNSTNNKIAILNSDGTLKQGSKTIDEILSSTTWDNIQGKPNNLATNESVATAKSDLESKISKKVDLVQVLSSVDLNTIFSVGLYSCTSCTNRPSNASSYGSLLVLKADGNSNITATTDTIQIYIDSNSKIFVRDSVDKTNSWDTWKEQVNTDLTGQLNNLRTSNKGNLVSAINEVFQLGVDRGGIIKNKIGALAGKTIQNMGDVADELEKYDVVDEEELIFSFKGKFTETDNFIQDDLLLEKNNSIINLENLSSIGNIRNGKPNINNTLYYKYGRRLDGSIIYDIKSRLKVNYKIDDFNLNYDSSDNELHFIKINNKLYAYSTANENELYDIEGSRKITVNWDRIVGTYGNKILTKKDNSFHIYNQNLQKERSFNSTVNRNIYSRFVGMLKDVFIYHNNSNLEIFSLSNGSKLRTYTLDNLSFGFQKGNILPVLGQLSMNEIYFVKNNGNVSSQKYHEVYRIDNSGNLTLHSKFLKESNGIHLYVSFDGKYVLVGGYNPTNKVYKFIKTLKKVRN